MFEGNLGPSLSRLSGRGKGRASVSWRSSGWRLVVLPLGTPRNPGDHHKPSPFWMVERRERGSEFALSGVRSTLLGSSSSSEGGGVRGSRGWSSGRMLRSRASAGAACWRASERDEQGGACCLSVFRSGMVPDGGCSPEGVGRVCRSDQGGVRFPGGKGGVVCGVLPQGGIVHAAPLLCLGVDPPWCSTDPASPTAALQKGLCWGVCRLYPGLRGCVRRGKKERGAESCCLLLKRLERCEGTRKKARHGERGGTAAPVVVLLPSPALQGLGWAVNVEGAVRGGAIGKRGWW